MKLNSIYGNPLDCYGCGSLSDPTCNLLTFSVTLTELPATRGIYLNLPGLISLSSLTENYTLTVDGITNYPTRVQSSASTNLSCGGINRTRPMYVLDWPLSNISTGRHTFTFTQKRLTTDEILLGSNHLNNDLTVDFIGKCYANRIFVVRNYGGSNSSCETIK